MTFCVMVGPFIPKCLLTVFLWGMLGGVYLDFKEKSCCWGSGCKGS